MGKVLDNISLYFSFLKASLKEILIYRIDCIVGIFSQLVVQLVSLIFIFVVFQHAENIAGWNFYQILLLYGVTRIPIGISGYCFDGLYDIGPKYIKNGDFDKILLRPVHPLISVIGTSREFASISDLFIGFGITIWMLIKLSIPITALLIIKIVFFSVVGAFIVGAINTIFSISSFWTYRSNEIIWSFYRMYTFTEYPITIYNKFIRFLITIVLPFAFVAYYPTMAYLGLNIYMIYLSPFVAIVLWIIAIKLWNLALNKYRSTGT